MFKFLLVFMAFPLFLSAQVKCDSFKGKEISCSYQTQFVYAEVLMEKINNTLRTMGKSLDNEDGYLEPGTTKVILEFFHNDPKVLELLKHLVVKLDKAPIPAKRRRVSVEINYFYFSNTVAKDRGFSFDFLFDGLVDTGMAKASANNGVLGFNFGNLTNHWFGLNINYANSQGLMSHRETLKFDTHEGKRLSIGEKTTYYRDGSTSTKTEKANKGVSGYIDIDDEDPNIIYIRNFRSTYPVVVNDSFSILTEKSFPEDYLRLRNGEVNVYWEHQVTKEQVTKDKKLLGRQSGSLKSTFKWIASVKVDIKEGEPEEEEILYDKISKTFYFSKHAKAQLISTAQSLSEIFGKKNLVSDVFRSPFGSLGNGLNIQFKPSVLGGNLLKLPLKWEVFGEGIDISRQIRLENLVAGPMFINEFSPKVVAEKKKKGEMLKLMMRLKIPSELSDHAKNIGLSEEAIDYLFYYYPSSGDLMLIDTKVYTKRPDKSLSRLIDIQKKRRRRR